ncbi:MAG: polysaccharide pyruvyl transferase family protein [Cyanobacterium sp. T60_A2020_053]|nr:polysaccharide pyruvyl transferase family protein [Cyanobacterium sp. T60_A2020_053]
MKKLVVLDTAVSSSNLGDQIIMDAVYGYLKQIFSGDFFVNIPTHDVISRTSYYYLRESDYAIVGGTNLLSANMNSYNQWKIGLYDSFFLNDIILMGVGWWQYQGLPNAYTKYLYHSVLNHQYAHSVRDEYTKKQLNAIGFNNVINTGCPTMWKLTEAHCQQITRHRSDSVLLTFTQYKQDESLDRQVVDILSERYDKIYYWIQQPNDYDYMKGFNCEKVIYVEPSLQALDRVLADVNLDYIGTRLHAGIRALQNKKRSLILAVDNRALEISKDTNLPVISRDDWDGIKSWIDSEYVTEVKLPWHNIEQWQQQFKG